MFKKVFIVVLDIIVYNKDDEVERKTSFNLEFMSQLDYKHIRVIISIQKCENRGSLG